MNLLYLKQQITLSKIRSLNKISCFVPFTKILTKNLIVRYSLLLTQRLGVRQLLTLVLCILSFFSLW